MTVTTVPVAWPGDRQVIWLSLSTVQGAVVAAICTIALFKYWPTMMSSVPENALVTEVIPGAGAYVKPAGRLQEPLLEVLMTTATAPAGCAGTDVHVIDSPDRAEHDIPAETPPKVTEVTLMKLVPARFQ